MCITLNWLGVTPGHPGPAEVEGRESGGRPRLCRTNKQPTQDTEGREHQSDLHAATVFFLVYACPFLTLYYSHTSQLFCLRTNKEPNVYAGSLARHSITQRSPQQPNEDALDHFQHPYIDKGLQSHTGRYSVWMNVVGVIALFICTGRLRCLGAWNTKETVQTYVNGTLYKEPYLEEACLHYSSPKNRSSVINLPISVISNLYMTFSSVEQK